VLRVAVVCAAAAFLVGFSGSDPRLAVVRTGPVTVKGTGFKAHDRVRVHLAAPGIDRTHRQRATARGSFTTAFESADVDECSGFTVTATGSGGERAKVHRRPPRACAPP
jgi:hypothetical protein